MAHSLYRPVEAARASLARLRYLSVLPRTVRQDFSDEFSGGRGMTVNVKGPITIANAARLYTQANRTARDAIVFDDLAQTYFPVTISDQVYKAVRLPDDFATFTLKNLADEVLAPMAEVVAEGVVEKLRDVMTTIVKPTTVPYVASDGSNVRSALIQARKVLNQRKVPKENRTLALGPGLEAAFLEDEQLQKVNESGDSSLLRLATIGRLFGFNIITAEDLPDHYGVAYNRDAFAHVTRASAPPKGAAFTATASEQGFALRYLQHYNPLQLEDQAVIDTFAGAQVLDADRAVALGLGVGSSGSVTIVDDTQTIAVGEEFTLEVRDGNGVTIPNELFTWTTSNAARATVDVHGVVTGVATGTAATITATYSDSKTDTAAITVS